MKALRTTIVTTSAVAMLSMSISGCKKILFPKWFDDYKVEIYHGNSVNSVRGLEYDRLRHELIISSTNPSYDYRDDDCLLFLTTSGEVIGELHKNFQYNHGCFVGEKGIYYVCDTYNKRVIKLTRDGRILLEINFTDDMGEPADIGLDSEGNIYVVSWPTGNWVNEVHSFDPGGKHRFSIGTEGTGDGEFGRADVASTNSIIVDDANNRFIVTDYGNDRLQVFTLSGEFICTWKPENLSCPQALGIDKDGFIYVAGDDLFKLNSKGEVVDVWVGLYDPYGVDIDENGTIYIASRSGRCVFKLYQD